MRLCTNCKLCIAAHMCGPVRASPGEKIEQIVVAGGIVSKSTPVIDTIEVYDISSNTWTTGVWIKKL